MFYLVSEMWGEKPSIFFRRLSQDHEHYIYWAWGGRGSRWLAWIVWKYSFWRSDWDYTSNSWKAGHRWQAYASGHNEKTVDSHRQCTSTSNNFSIDILQKVRKFYKEESCIGDIFINIKKIKILLLKTIERKWS